MSFWIRLFVALVPPFVVSCSIQQIALNSVADALSGPGNYGQDRDPLFIERAAPFGLKLMESIAEKLPKHQKIRLSLASGYVQYSYAFVQQDADRLEQEDISQAKPIQERAKHFYLRAREFALDAVELRHPGLRAKLLGSPPRLGWDSILSDMKKEDVPYLYWTAASWALAISVSKEPKYIGDLPVVFALIRRAFALDESWGQGTLHEFFVSTATTMAQGDEETLRALDEALFHQRRAMALSHGSHLGVLVSYAESVLVPAQAVVPRTIAQIQDPIVREEAMAKRTADLHHEFVSMLEHVLRVDIDQPDPLFKENRLANEIARRRARWLLARQGDLFGN